MKKIICHHCDLVSQIPFISKRNVAKCSRCNSTIYKNSTLKPSEILALCMAGSFICYPAFTLPLISLHMLDITEGTALIDGPLIIFHSDPIVAIMVLFCAIVAPVMSILSIGYSSACIIFNHYPTHLPKVFKLTNILTHWSMLDVYMLSIFVSISKLLHYADLSIGLGFYFFVPLLLIHLTIIANYSNCYYWELFHQRDHGANKQLRVNC